MKKHIFFTIQVIVVLFSFAIYSQTTTINCQNFESNNNGWSGGSRVSENISGSANSYRLDNGQYTTSNSYNFSNFSKVVLEFTFESKNFETDNNDDDSYIVEFNDGSGWVELKRVLHGYGFQNDIHQTVSITVLSSTYNFSNGTNDRFRIKNHTDSSNDKLFIDDICITGFLPFSVAEIKGNGIAILDGDTTPNTSDFTDYGVLNYTSGSLVRTFTIQNNGLGTLTIGNIVFTGSASSDFTITNSPQSSIAPGATSTFQVRLDPSEPGTRSTQIVITTNDPSRNPYNFSLKGFGDDPNQSTIACQDFQFNSNGWIGGSIQNENISGSSKSLKLTSQQYLTSTPRDFSNYNLVTLEFTFESKNFETDSNDDDSYIVEFNDGSGWVELKRVLHGYGFLNNIDQTVRISISSKDYNFSGSNESFRIKCNTDSSNDVLFIDDVCLFGSKYCYTNLSCSGSTTWNGSTWSSGAPSNQTEAIINGNYSTLFNSNFKCCKLTINSGRTLTIQNGGMVEVQSDITNNGNITVNNNGSLLQYYDNAINTGNITVIRQSNNLYQFDYTYWSSPVSGFNMSKIAHNRAYYWNENTGSWSRASGIMEPTRGYILMTDNQSKTTPTKTTATFTGPMNNGRVFRSLNNSKDDYNLIGNPYPSALKAADFLSDPDNQKVLGGTLYFWTHNTRISGIASNRGFFTENDYASWNLTGGVGAVSANLGGLVPDGRIASGQGFFAEVVAPGSVKFTNCMRATNVVDNSKFFRPSQDEVTEEESTPSEQEENDNVARLWLDVTNQDGSYKQILIGYIAGATNGLDRLYDGESLDGENKVSLYSINKDSEGKNKHLSIQGRALPFNDNDTVQLGFNMQSEISKTNTIAISNIGGDFKTKNIYLIDNQTGITHDLKSGPYTFESEPGEFEDRFEVTYVNRSLSIADQKIQDANVVVAAKSGVIQVQSKTAKITNVSVSDMFGKQIYNSSLDQTTSLIEINSLTVKNQVVIVKTTLEDGIISLVKVML